MKKRKLLLKKTESTQKPSQKKIGQKEYPISQSVPMMLYPDSVEYNGKKIILPPPLIVT